MASEILTGMLPKVSISGIARGIMIFLILIIVLAIIGSYLFILVRNKRFKEFKVIILERDSTGNTHETYDQAGIFLNKKTNLKLLFLKKFKKGLDPNNVPYVISKDKKGKMQKVIYLLKTGVSNYRFIKVSIESDMLKFTVGEEDVNWAAQDYETIIKTFQKEGFWGKYGGYILFVISIIVIMIILISLFNKFTVLKDTANALQSVSNNLLEIAKIMNATNAPGAPVIIPT